MEKSYASCKIRTPEIKRFAFCLFFMNVLLYFLFLSGFSYNQEIQIPLNEIVKKADLIIKGKVIETQSNWIENENGRHIYTKAIIKIDELIKGNYNEHSIELEVMGGTVGDVTEYVTNSFSYEKGEELFLFLDAKTKYPVGNSQGKISIYDKKVFIEGKEINSAQFDVCINEILLDNNFDYSKYLESDFPIIGDQGQNLEFDSPLKKVEEIEEQSDLPQTSLNGQNENSTSPDKNKIQLLEEQNNLPESSIGGQNEISTNPEKTKVQPPEVLEEQFELPQTSLEGQNETSTSPDKNKIQMLENQNNLPESSIGGQNEISTDPEKNKARQPEMIEESDLLQTSLNGQNEISTDPEKNKIQPPEDQNNLPESLIGGQNEISTSPEINKPQLPEKIESELPQIQIINDGNDANFKDPDKKKESLLLPEGIEESYSIYNAWRTDQVDADANGYYQSFKLHFDPDVSSGTYVVYVKLYYKLSTATAYSLLWTSPDYTISGYAVDDKWVQLAANSTTPYRYDFKLELYKVGSSLIRATRGPTEDTDLNDVPMQLDQTLTLYNAWRTDQIDADANGYYENFKLHWDADAAYGSASVYVKLYSKLSTATTYTLIYTSPVYTITGAAVDDRWVQLAATNTPPYMYDFKLELYKSGSGLIRATRGPTEDVDLNDVPLQRVLTFTLYNAWRTDQVDADANGYYESIKLHWDPDVSYGSASVFVKLYYKLSTATAYTLLWTSPNYTINGYANDDQWVTVSTTNTTPYRYDFKIELYKVGSSTIRATRGPTEDYDLNDVPMQRDQILTLFNAWRTDQVDNDANGYYENFKLHWDADAAYGSASVYVKVYSKLSTATTYTLVYTSPVYTITGAAVDDRWVQLAATNTPPYMYDFKLELYKSGSGLIRATRGPTEDVDLNDVPLQRVLTFTLYNAWRTDQVDADANGYYQSIKLHWDPDVSYGSASVFVKIYSKLSTATTYSLMYTSPNYTINGYADDDQWVTVYTTNTTPYRYDFKIELYKVGSSTIRATRGPTEDTDLNDVPMQLDQILTLYNSWRTDQVDANANGYYESFKLHWDADANYGSASVYVKLYYKVSTATTYTLLYTSSTYTITGAVADDRWVELIANSTSLSMYDFKLELYKSGSSLIRATRGPTEDTDLNDVKMQKISGPFITNITPSKQSAGTNSSVTIVGTNFGSTQGVGKVEFFYRSGQPKISAPIVSWSNTQIICRVPTATVNGYPASAGSGPVTVKTNSGTTSNGYIFKITFGYGGVKWSGTSPIVNYRINENYAPIIGEGTVVRAAATTWTNAGAKFTFTYAGTTTATTRSQNSKNEVLWQTLGTGILGQASIWSSSGYITECDFSYSTLYAWSADGTPTGSEYDIQTVAVHELGHWLFLRDLYGDIGDNEYDKAKIMYGFGSPGVLKRNLHADDIAGIRWIYGTLTAKISVTSNIFGSIEKQVHGNNIQLNWEITSDLIEGKFQVERSANLISGAKNWQKIGEIDLLNGNESKSFSYSDNLNTAGKFSYRIKFVNDGDGVYSDEIETEILPADYALYQNYPNPFNPATNIKFALPKASKLTLVVYNILGEIVADLLNENKEAGVYDIQFDASNLSSGTYIYRLTADDFVQTKKLTLIK